MQLVPRLDLKEVSARAEGGAAAARARFGRQPAVRPPPRPFSLAEARTFGLAVARDRYEPGVVTLGSHRFKGGYTLRTVALKSLLRVEAPAMEEAAAYQAAAAAAGDDEAPRRGGGAGGDLDSLPDLAAALPEAAARRATFVPGDRVVVVAGDLLNLEAVVTRADGADGGPDGSGGGGGLVYVRSLGGDGVDGGVELPLDPSEIVKAFRVRRLDGCGACGVGACLGWLFVAAALLARGCWSKLRLTNKPHHNNQLTNPQNNTNTHTNITNNTLQQVGDHVRVLAGAHKGETGLVVQVDRGACAVVGDASRAQFRVNARDLAEERGSAPGIEVPPLCCCVLLCLCWLLRHCAARCLCLLCAALLPRRRAAALVLPRCLAAARRQHIATPTHHHPPSTTT